MKRNVALFAAIACLLLWTILAFVVAIPSGWVNLPLALGTTLLAVAIVETAPAHSGGGDVHVK